ncbi:MAG: hypothetical protein JSU61_12830 [Fidelibacterota bacterium]|nr:MAG: hypothetical protein JSU61_12830 [Candidatus Neomarinimicrobiota bacterium]
MRHIAAAGLIAAFALLLAQEAPPTAQPASQDTTPELAAPPPAEPTPTIEPIPSQLPATGPPASPFYHPPVIREVWSRFYQLVDTLDDRALTRRFIRSLMDSLAGSIQTDFDSLVVRARAFETTERGYTHRFYRSPLTRDEILGIPITAEEADVMPHFHAVYDPQGYLLRVRYVEPRKWRAKQELLARGVFRSEPGSTPLVRYFLSWDVRYLEPALYTRKRRMPENEAFVRVIYDEQDNIESLQSYDQHGELEYELDYGRIAIDSTAYAQLEFKGDTVSSLLDIHPYVYLRDWSVVKPGWKVALTRDGNGALASTQVFNELNQISYYYTFHMESDPESRARTLRGTVLSDADRIEQVFALFYNKDDRMIRRSFYTADGQLLETTTYDYHPKTSELVVITRNAVGTITSRQRYIDPAFWN